MNPDVLFWALVICAGLFACFGVLILVRQRQTPRERIVSRLKGVKQIKQYEMGDALAETRERELERKKARKEALRRKAFTEIPTLEDMHRQVTFGERLEGKLLQAQLALTMTQFLFLSGVLCVLGVLVSVLWRRGVDPLLAGIFGLSLGGAPWLYVWYRVRRRMKRFNLQLPDALDLMSSSVKSGQSLNAAIQNVADEMPDPIAEEFRIVSDELTFGVSFEESLRHLMTRADTPDVRFFSTALMIQKETGGNLSEVLDGLQMTIRERFRILGQVRTLTAQGKLSGLIVALLPVALCGLIYMANPDYMSSLFTTLIGRYLVFGAIGLQLIGVFFIFKIVNIEV